MCPRPWPPHQRVQRKDAKSLRRKARRDPGFFFASLRLCVKDVYKRQAQFGTQFYREPVNARYYFNDDTRELVLVAPHVNGRELDVEATLQRFVAQINSDNHAVPIVLRDITPVAHAGATAADLGLSLIHI